MMNVHRNAAMRQQPRTRRAQPAPVTASQVNPAAMDLARQLAKGWEHRPILIGGIREITILNYPGQRWPAKRTRRRA